MGVDLRSEEKDCRTEKVRRGIWNSAQRVLLLSDHVLRASLRTFCQ